MKKLSDYKGQKIAIHFPTYELWLRRKEINPSDTCKDEYFYDYEDGIYYDPFGYNRTGARSELYYYKNNNHEILPATDFLEEVLEEEFVYGQEYEFSDYEDFKNKCIRKFIAKSTCGKYFITWNEKSSWSGYYKYCRKINTERNEAITKAKELITKFGIKQDELF